MEKFRDVVIIGAGPAGLSAAGTAARYGLDVLVLDEQPALGGQIYRNIENASTDKINTLGSDYRRGRGLAERFRKSDVQYMPNAIVWRIDPNGNICFSKDGASTEINAKNIVIATGAMERPVPFPGWTLPGVMGVGAVDANFKSSGVVPDGPVVLAGSGPLLLYVAGHLATLGVRIGAVLDTTPNGHYLSSLPFLPKALRRPDYLLKGMGMLLNARKTGINYIRGVKEYRAHGNGRLDHVFVKTKNGVQHIDAGILLVHEGIIPRCDFTRQLGLPHLWNPVQRYWHPKTDGVGATEIEPVHVAGDGGFVHGGIPAELKGALAALDIAGRRKALPGPSAADTMKQIQKKLATELAPRPFVDALYKPRVDLYAMADETLVCRCEAVTAGDIRQALRNGCRAPNEVKAMTRCGMGQCQSRMCGAALAEICAEGSDMDASDLIPLNIRPPVRNISLSELAELDLLESPAP